MLGEIPASANPDLLVGFENCDDAGVYRLDDERALVLTADLISPPVDDPYVFGQIAAANSLSDIYAMGGTPLACLNLVCFPSEKLGTEVLSGIIEGAHDKIRDANAVLVGGHSVEDPEPKFGLSVTGIVQPDRIWTNAGVRDGDYLILTKPLGSGVLLNANLKHRVSERAMQICLDTLGTLNDRAAKVMMAFDVHAATDVTGFGLAGHAMEMAKASELLLEIDSSVLPGFDEALQMYDKGFTTAANKTNRLQTAQHTRIAPSVSSNLAELLFDPQTNGGLLLSVSEREAMVVVEQLHDTGIEHATIIGQARPHRSEEYLNVL